MADADRDRRVLAVTGGHRIDVAPFLDMVDDVCASRGWTWAHSRQPSADGWLAPETAPLWDAVLFYDLRGLHLKRGEEPRPLPADTVAQARLVELTRLGTGIVSMHHSLASWAAWDGWADIVGGRFHYAPGTLRGEPWPSSGTRFTRHTVEVLDAGHPVTRGVSTFTLDDELYYCPAFPDEVTPLLRTTDPMDPTTFISTRDHVVVGEELAADCTDHPPASDVVAWCKESGSSRVVYVQPGEDGRTFGLPDYRTLIGNALAWTMPDIVS